MLTGEQKARYMRNVQIGVGDLLIGRLLIIDTFTMSFFEAKMARHHECPVCGGQNR